MAETAYPLSWPAGWKRTPYRKDAQFRHQRGTLPMDVALRRLSNELARLGGEHEVLSTNCQRRVDGSLKVQQNPADPGVAVYFTLKKRRVVLACDKWQRVQDNIAAIAAHIEALRGQERWGVGTLEQAFKGYESLEDFTMGIPWRRVLGYKPEDRPTLSEVETKWKSRMKELHPDVTGGVATQAAQLNVAMDQARKELRAA